MNYWNRNQTLSKVERIHQKNSRNSSQN